MQLFHSYHHMSFHRLIHSDFWLFELSVWFHVFARSLVAVFIPILLLQIDYSIGEVMIYYFLYHLFDVPLNFFARWLVRKIGARKVIALGILASIGFFLFLFNLVPSSWPLLIALAFFAAVYDVLYWVAHIYFFMESSKKRENASKDTSILYMVRRIGGMLAPACGGLILIFFNQKALIVVSIILLFVSLLPLLKMEKTKDKPTNKQMSFRRFFRHKEDLRNYLVMGLFSIHRGAENIIFPLFIYLIFETIESVALVPIIVSMTAIVFSFFAGRIKRDDRTNMIAIGSLLVAIVWILRMLFDSTGFYYVSIFLVGLFSVLISIPINSGIYERGEKRDPLTASTYQNAIAMGTKLILFGLLALLVNVFQVSFIFATISLFLMITAIFFFGPTERMSVGAQKIVEA